MTYFGLTYLDSFALALFFFMMFYFNIRVEYETSERPSTYSLMVRHRKRWMQVLTTRKNRIVDMQVIAILQQSSRFFASGMMIAIGGVIALMARPEIMTELSNIIHRDIPQASWSFRLFFTALVLANGFLKFIWAGRLFGYTSIVMASVPEEETPESQREAARAAALNVTASRSFNRGLRSIYFALASLCWLIGSIPFIVAILFVSFTIWRREFNSASRAALLEDFDG